MPISEGAYCPGCGLANYAGMCPHCSGDQARYEEELAFAFGSSIPAAPPELAELNDAQQDAILRLAASYDEVDADAPEAAADGAAVVRVLSSGRWTSVIIDARGRYDEPYGEDDDIPF